MKKVSFRCKNVKVIIVVFGVFILPTWVKYNYYYNECLMMICSNQLIKLGHLVPTGGHLVTR